MTALLDIGQIFIQNSNEFNGLFSDNKLHSLNENEKQNKKVKDEKSRARGSNNSSSSHASSVVHDSTPSSTKPSSSFGSSNHRQHSSIARGAHKDVLSTSIVPTASTPIGSKAPMVSNESPFNDGKQKLMFIIQPTATEPQKIIFANTQSNDLASKLNIPLFSKNNQGPIIIASKPSETSSTTKVVSSHISKSPAMVANTSCFSLRSEPSPEVHYDRSDPKESRILGSLLNNESSVVTSQAMTTSIPTKVITSSATEDVPDQPKDCPQTQAMPSSSNNESAIIPEGDGPANTRYDKFEKLRTYSRSNSSVAASNRKGHSLLPKK